MNDDNSKIVSDLTEWESVEIFVTKSVPLNRLYDAHSRLDLDLTEKIEDEILIEMAKQLRKFCVIHQSDINPASPNITFGTSVWVTKKVEK